MSKDIGRIIELNHGVAKVVAQLAVELDNHINPVHLISERSDYISELTFGAMVSGTLVGAHDNVSLSNQTSFSRDSVLRIETLS
jgi:hypothetical protein